MMHSDEKIPTDTKEGLELEVQSPYLDKTALDTKIGLTSQNVKHDSYFQPDEDQIEIKHLQTDHQDDSQKDATN